MTRNQGAVDRGIRVILGLALVGLTLSGKIGPWGWIGLLPILTGLIGWCPAYSLMGLKTCTA
jgi:Protein of unknown function (DUF2892)